MSEFYLLLRDLHYFISRAGFALVLAMLVVAVYIGLIRHGDVTYWYRRATYAIAGLMVLEAAIGALMYVVIGVRPGEDVHLIYGMGAFLALPFFIFVEVTAKKRPAMGSYIWGFAVLAGIFVRSIMTGPPG
jgi:hypothetical protein